MINPVIDTVLFFWAILALASTTGAFLVTKFVRREARVALRMISQPSLTVMGMMFSIMLGFFIAQALKDYSNSTTTITDEAGALGEVFRDARGLPEVDRKRIRVLCRKYADVVTSVEWPLLSKYKASQEAQNVMNELWEASLSVTPTNSREQVIYGGFFKAMNELGTYRRIRVATNTASIATHLWVIIAIGAASIVVMTFLFAPDSKPYHVGLLSCILVPLTLNIYLLADFSNPFSGLITVKPLMFNALKRNNLIDNDDAPVFLKGQGTTP